MGGEGSRYTCSSSNSSSNYSEFQIGQVVCIYR